MLVLIIIPATCWAQKIVVNEYDKFLKQRKIEFAPHTLVSTPHNKMDITLGSIGASAYVKLSGSGSGATIVNDGDRVIFLLDNDSTITVRSTGLQTYDVVATTTSYKHKYSLQLSDLEKFSKHNLQALRKYHAEEFDDVFIPEQNRSAVKNLSNFLVQELKKDNINIGTIAETKPAVSQPAITATPKKADLPVTSSSMPAFPGGEEVWKSFLKRNLTPPAELRINEKKNVLAQFVVNADGSVTNIQIIESAGSAYDKEVLRVLKRMPYWKPSTENGRAKNSVVTQSITFFRPGNSSAGL